MNLIEAKPGPLKATAYTVANFTSHPFRSSIDHVLWWFLEDTVWYPAQIGSYED